MRSWRSWAAETDSDWQTLRQLMMQENSKKRKGREGDITNYLSADRQVIPRHVNLCGPWETRDTQTSTITGLLWSRLCLAVEILMFLWKTNYQSQNLFCSFFELHYTITFRSNFTSSSSPCTANNTFCNKYSSNSYMRFTFLTYLLSPYYASQIPLIQ